MDNRTTLGIIAGIAIVISLSAGLTFFLQYSKQDGDIFLINKNGGTPVNSCDPSGGLILAQNLTDLCDVVIIDPQNEDILEYNGTHWVNIDSFFLNDTVTCTNTGSGVIICPSVSEDNVFLRTLIEGTGIDISNSTTEITITNTLPENTVCDNQTSGEGLCINDNVELKNLLAGSFISLSSNSTHVTITNTGVTSNSCTSPISCSGSTGAVTISCPTCNTDWILLDNVTASNASTSLNSNTFTAYKYIRFDIFIDTQTSTSAWRLRFNSDSGNNYGYRVSVNGGADTTASADSSLVLGNSWSSGEVSYTSIVCEDYITSENKICNAQYGSNDSTPDRYEGTLIWKNTANQITSSQIIRASGTGTLTTNTNMMVWGHN